MRNLKLVRSAKRNLLNNDMREVSDAHTKTLASDDLTRASGDRDQPGHSGQFGQFSCSGPLVDLADLAVRAVGLLWSSG